MSVGGWTAAAKAEMLNAELALVTHLSLHRGDPGGTLANEVSGGSPAYARKAVTWNAASGATPATAATPPTFDVPANAGGAADYYVCGCTASSGGTAKFKIKVGSAPLNFPTQSTLPISGLSIDHNLGITA